MPRKRISKRLRRKRIGRSPAYYGSTWGKPWVLKPRQSRNRRRR